MIRVYIDEIVLGFIFSFSPFQKGQEEIDKVNKQMQGYEQLKELISIDTLKTMQLLGFNFKSAIGEPLTEICANALNLLTKKRSDKNG